MVESISVERLEAEAERLAREIENRVSMVDATNLRMLHWQQADNGRAWNTAKEAHERNVARVVALKDQQRENLHDRVEAYGINRRRLDFTRWLKRQGGLES